MGVFQFLGINHLFHMINLILNILALFQSQIFMMKMEIEIKKEPILYLINCLLCTPFFFKSKVWVIGQWPMIHVLPVDISWLNFFRKNIYVEWWETLENQWLKRGLAGKIGKMIEHITLKMSSFVTFVVECESEKELMIKKNPKAKVIIVPTGVDEKYFLMSQKNTPLILFPCVDLKKSVKELIC